MIEYKNTYAIVIFYCDTIGCEESIEIECGDSCDAKFAAKEAKEFGWKIHYEDGGFIHECPDCEDE